MSILSNLNRFARSRARFLEFSKDPELKAKSKYFGIWSITESIITVVLAFITFFCISLATHENPFIMLLGLLLGLGLGIGTIGTLISSFINMRRQLRMNKLAIGKVAMILFIVSLVGAAIAAVVVFIVIGPGLK